MITYPKINSVYKRYEDGPKKGQFILDEFSQPEFEYLYNNDWEWSYKVDGTNIRISFTDDCVLFGGRTNNADIPSMLLNKLKVLFPLELLKETFKRNEDGSWPDITIFGEGYGHKIQKVGSSYIKNDNDFILFDIKVGNWWLKREDLEHIASQLNIKIAPVISYGTLGDAIRYVMTGFKSPIAEDKNLDAEGLVLRTTIGLLNRSGQRIMTKVKTRDFIN